MVKNTQQLHSITNQIKMEIASELGISNLKTPKNTPKRKTQSNKSNQQKTKV